MSIHTKRHNIAIGLAIVVAIVGLAVVYRHIDPSSSWLVPRCPMKLLTGYDCPSCGNQRMLHALLNGEFGEALLLNPFMLIATPYILALVVTYLLRDVGWITPVRNVVWHKSVAFAYIALYFIWWVVRNTPFWLRTVERWSNMA